MIWLILFLVGASPCDSTLWNHVYHKDRLQVQVACQEFVGVKADATHGKRKNGCRKEADGDDHCWLHLDLVQYGTSAPNGLINDENRKKQDGNLVFEPMCQHKVTQADAKAVCQNWSQSFQDLPIGAHVKLMGAWVLDTQHGHMECHPCQVVEILK